MHISSVVVKCSGQESQADLFDLAVESLKKSVDLSPNDAQFWCTLGTVAAVAGGTKQELAKYALMRSLMINGQVSYCHKVLNISKNLNLICYFNLIVLRML